MSVEIYRLQKLMNDMNRDELLLLLSKFKCSRNRDSEYFLKKIALRHEAKDISRTYLAIDPNEKKIFGYFTLAFKCLNVKNIEVDADIAELMNIKDYVAQSYLLGQLARSDDAERGSGKIMLDEAMKRFSDGKEMLGCRMVRLDCRDELIYYYRSQGFRSIGKNADLDLNQMAKFI